MAAVVNARALIDAPRDRLRRWQVCVCVRCVGVEHGVLIVRGRNHRLLAGW